MLARGFIFSMKLKASASLMLRITSNQSHELTKI